MHWYVKQCPLVELWETGTEAFPDPLFGEREKGSSDQCVVETWPHPYVIYFQVNLATTSVSKMATDFAENELDLFRKAVSTVHSLLP